MDLGNFHPFYFHYKTFSHRFSHEKYQFCAIIAIFTFYIIIPMGTLLLKLLITCILITSALYLEAQDLRDKNGIKTGSVDDHGNIRDKNGIKTGSFDKDNVVRDKNGIKTGEVDEHGAIRDKNGIKLGSVDDDGTVRNKNGIRLGTIDDDGDVRDKNGIRLGKAKEMDKKKAAVLFFFR